VGTSVLSPG